MTHLKPAEIIDAAEGHSTPEREQHLRVCASCQEQVNSAARMLGDVKMVPAPEPSPLYWEHLSANIRTRISSEPRSRRSRAWIWAPATAAAGALALVIGLSNTQVTDRALPPNVGVGAPTEQLDQLPAEDASWSLVSDASEDLGWDDAEAAGLAVRPGAADHAAAQLPDDQRQELARLLEEEMARLKS